MSKHSNISIFIPHLGCPNRCSFCNQRTISSTVTAPTAAEVRDMLEKSCPKLRSAENTEIAFFGGSFTAIDRSYMTELLKAANEFVRRFSLRGIRISTRPDCIDEEILSVLKKYGVTSIELGAQSMSDSVLEKNHRGHSAEDVKRASAMIKSFGFETGLQMMVGLYGSTESDEYHTMREITAIRPDTVRIYPVSVLEGTHLAELYKSGEYVLFPFEKAVKICAVLYSAFTSAGIKVIRMGLHAEDGVAMNAVAGFYHPAFGEIVRSEIIKNAVLKYREFEKTDNAPLDIRVNSSLAGAVYGHKKSNRIFFEQNNIPVKISVDNSLADGEISINKEVRNVFKIT